MQWAKKPDVTERSYSRSGYGYWKDQVRGTFLPPVFTRNFCSGNTLNNILFKSTSSCIDVTLDLLHYLNCFIASSVHFTTHYGWNSPFFGDRRRGKHYHTLFSLKLWIVTQVMYFKIGTSHMSTLISFPFSLIFFPLLCCFVTHDFLLLLRRRRHMTW